MENQPTTREGSARPAADTSGWSTLSLAPPPRSPRDFPSCHARPSLVVFKPCDESRLGQFITASSLFFSHSFSICHSLFSYLSLLVLLFLLYSLVCRVILWFWKKKESERTLKSLLMTRVILAQIDGHSAPEAPIYARARTYERSPLDATAVSHVRDIHTEKPRREHACIRACVRA